MPDYASINGVAAADIASINGVAKASVATVSGAATPASSSGASRWVGVTDGGFVIHAADSDRTSSGWTVYDGVSGATPKAYDIGFGKNSSGENIYICSRAGSSRELQISGTDVTTDATWTDINLPNDTQHCVMWGARSDGTAAGTWFAVGEQDNEQIFRSTDGGANWSAIDLSGLTGHQGGTSNDLKGIASNGAGRWAFAQAGRLYVSTDDGATFTVSTPWGSDTPGVQQGITFTNNTWVIAYTRSSKVRVRTCSDSDLTDWSDEFYPAGDITGGEEMANPDTQEKRVNICSANGRVCMISTGHDLVTYFDVNGKTISNAGQNDLSDTLSLGGDTAKDICTDGSTWIISMQDGDIWESTDSGETWGRTVNALNIGGSTSRDILGITCDVLLPL